MRRLVAATALLLAGCSSSSPHRLVLELPAGSLAAYVPQPGQVPTGMVFVAAQTGPQSLDQLVADGGDAARLAADGFVDAYVVEYADPKKGTEIVTTVVRFATAAGATTDLAADLATPDAAATPVTAATVGDQSAAAVQALPGGSAKAQLVTVRFRQGVFSFLVGVGAPGTVDPASVVAIAQQLATRAKAAPTPTVRVAG